MTKIVYSSDLHGNELHYRKLVEYANGIPTDIVIIGGDIAPSKFESEYIKGQRIFLQDRLPSIFDTLGEGIEVFLMMGNDDCMTNRGVLEKGDMYRTIHGRRFRLADDFEIIGYPFVPITPFDIKDWERFDFSEVPPDLRKRYEKRKKTEYRMKGVISTSAGWQEVTFRPESESVVSIQRHLKKEIYTRNPRKTVYVMHAPPDDTCLDLIRPGEHLGSMAVRQFIEDHQPYLTLHGHIHPTVEVSGSFQERIGTTLSLASGNDPSGEDLAILVFDLEDPENVERELI
tara:strand:- start:6196 stop:7056 length:861 start_codon:yes stop_codon:yes gene_type:complete